MKDNMLPHQAATLPRQCCGAGSIPQGAQNPDVCTAPVIYLASLQALCRSASRKWYSHSGEGLALLAIGLAQYNYSAFRQQQPQQSASSMPAKDKDRWEI
jgi:hypothetical protein